MVECGSAFIIGTECDIVIIMKDVSARKVTRATKLMEEGDAE